MRECAKLRRQAVTTDCQFTSTYLVRIYKCVFDGDEFLAISRNRFKRNKFSRARISRRVPARGSVPLYKSVNYIFVQVQNTYKIEYLTKEDSVTRLEIAKIRPRPRRIVDVCNLALLRPPLSGLIDLLVSHDLTAHYCFNTMRVKSSQQRV